MTLTVELTDEQAHALRYLALQIQTRQIEEIVSPEIVQPGLEAMHAIWRELSKPDRTETEQERQHRKFGRS